MSWLAVLLLSAGGVVAALVLILVGIILADRVILYGGFRRW